MYIHCGNLIDQFEWFFVLATTSEAFKKCHTLNVA